MFSFLNVYAPVTTWNAGDSQMKETQTLFPKGQATDTMKQKYTVMT